MLYIVLFFIVSCGGYWYEGYETTFYGLRMFKRKTGWMEISNKFALKNAEMVYVPSHDKLILIGCNAESNDSQKKIWICDYHTGVVSHSKVSLPFQDCYQNRVAITYHAEINAILCTGYIRNHNLSIVPISVEHLIEAYMRICLLKIMDHDGNMWSIDVDHVIHK